MLQFFFSFDGRVRRTHFFFGALVTTLIGWLFGIHWLHASHFRWVGDYDAIDVVRWPTPPAFWLISTVVGIGVFWAKLALTAKRWHDAGATGWLTLLSLVWGLDGIIFLLLCLIPPTRGPNQYGPDPRNELAPA